MRKISAKKFGKKIWKKNSKKKFCSWIFEEHLRNNIHEVSWNCSGIFEETFITGYVTTNYEYFHQNFFSEFFFKFFFQIFFSKFFCQNFPQNFFSGFFFQIFFSKFFCQNFPQNFFLEFFCKFFFQIFCQNFLLNFFRIFFEGFAREENFGKKIWKKNLKRNSEKYFVHEYLRNI